MLGGGLAHSRNVPAASPFRASFALDRLDTSSLNDLNLRNAVGR